MSTVKISQLSATSGLNSADVLPVVDSGANPGSPTTYKITVKNLADSLTQVTSSISSSYAITASYALNGGGSSTPGGSPNQLQYNNAGAFGGVSTATFDGTNLRVTGSFSGSLVGQLTGTSSWSNYPISVTGSTLYSTSPSTSQVRSINSIFFGSQSGYQASNAGASNFLGPYAGFQATSAFNSNFLGSYAGYAAAGANNSNFLGADAGLSASNAAQSNIIGIQAGYQAKNASNSNFIGTSAGYEAVNAPESNFIGNNAGYQATNAAVSTFIGGLAGAQAASASYCILIGLQAGYNVAGGALGIKSNNIIIGTNITLEDGRKDSINLGGIIFASGSYSNTGGNPFSGSVGNGRVGINIVNPSYNLDVSGSGNFTSGLTITGSLIVSGSPSPEIRVIGEMTVTGSVIISGSSALRIFNSASIVSGSLSVGNITPSSTVGRIDASNDIVAYSTSDARLKTEVSPIHDPISKVNMISGVSFTWIENPEVHGNFGKDVGVIAQEIEKVLPEVVTTRDSGYKAVKYEKIIPLLIEAIKDLQKQIDELKAGK